MREELVLNKFISWLSYKPRSERESERKLTALLAKFSDPDDVDDLGGYFDKFMGRARELKLISDEESISSYLQGFNLSSRARSPKQITQYLSAKGFNTQKIQQAMQELDPEQDVQMEKAVKEGQKFIDSRRYAKLTEARSDLGSSFVRQYLYTKGYAKNSIERAITTLFGVK